MRFCRARCVRKSMKRMEIKEAADCSEFRRYESERYTARNWVQKDGGVHFEARQRKSQNILSYDYDSVNTSIND